MTAQNRSILGEKPIPMLLCPQNAMWAGMVSNPRLAVRSRRLSAWPMARLAVCIHLNMKHTNYVCAARHWTITQQRPPLWRTFHCHLLPSLLILFITAINCATPCHLYTTAHNRFLPSSGPIHNLITFMTTHQALYSKTPKQRHCFFTSVAVTRNIVHTEFLFKDFHGC
jgi:hypothetical protein